MKNFDLAQYESEQQRKLNPVQIDSTMLLLQSKQSQLNKKKSKKSKSNNKFDSLHNENELKSDQSQKPTLTPGEVEILKLRSENIIVGSQLIYYKNGVSQGIAYNDVLRAIYMPSVSLYMGATVEFNFGPYYWCPPNELLFMKDIQCNGLYTTLQSPNTIIKKNPTLPVDKLGIQISEQNVLQNKTSRGNTNRFRKKSHT